MVAPATRTSSHEDDRKSLSRPSSADSSPLDHKRPVGDAENFDVGSDGVVILKQSRGVTQMEALTSRLSLKYKILLYGGFAILAYVMSLGEYQFAPFLPRLSLTCALASRLLDQYTAGTYLTTATSVSFSAHSVLATVRSIKSVFQAVSQPPIAKIADVLGRVEAYALCVCLYAVGQAISAASPSIYVFATGNAIYILGSTGLFLLQNIIIADISSTRNRLFWSIFPSIPGTINVWVSGNITGSLLEGGAKNSNWRWGIGESRVSNSTHRS